MNISVRLLVGRLSPSSAALRLKIPSVLVLKQTLRREIKDMGFQIPLVR